MIRIENIKTCKIIGENEIVYFCGRPSSLGNPYLMNNMEDRDVVCELYDKYLPNAYREKEEVKKSIDELVEYCKKGNSVVLMCYCYPKRCHCESIRKFVEKLVINNKCYSEDNGGMV